MWTTVDREYFVGSKLSWAKHSMRFNFVNLACVWNYFNTEILIHGVFTHWCSMAAYEMESCLQDYHVYKDIWAAMIVEVLLWEREPFNDVDRYAVAVLKDDTTIGHIPKKISRICSLF